MKKRTVVLMVLLATVGICAFFAALKIKNTPLTELLPLEKKADYTLDAAESDPVDNTFFEESAFVGHSLIEGLAGYSDLTGPDFYAKTGFSVQQSLSHRRFKLPDGTTGRLRDGLGQVSYRRVYLMFGINEISLGAEAFQTDFESMVDLVREYQPDAQIYILALTPTTKAKSDGSAFNRKNIMAYNEALRALCGERECIFVNLFDCFADENGYLPAKKSSDGIHLNADQYAVMLDYIKRHTTPETR